MGMTICEKILSAHSGRDCVKPGDFLNVKADIVFGNELGTGLAIHGREELLKKGVFDPSKIAIIPDHFTPNKDITSAELSKVVREFVREQKIEHYFEVGKMGIEHVILHEKGLVVAGDVVVGADSHTCTYGALGTFAAGVGSTDFFAALMLGEVWLKVPETIKIVYTGKMGKWVTAKDLILYTVGMLGADGARYKAIEFCGDAVNQISMEGRFTMCNMVVEAGAKNAVFAPDSITEEYLKGRAVRGYRLYESDPDARYERVIEIDVSQISPQLACPYSPDNVKPLEEVLSKGKLWLDQVFIGSCTNGRIEDLRLAGQILKGKKVHSNTRLIIIPGSQDVYLQAVEEGLVKIFVEAGAAVGTPTCGPCIGGHMGVLASGERCISTTNRNFKGRMGHYDSQLYLSGVPVAAASAICGYIASPEEVE